MKDNSKNTKNTRGRNFFLTLWRDEENKEFLERTTDLPEWINYSITSREICPTTKKEHFHSYIECKRTTKINRIKKLTGKKTHIEITRGSQMDNIKYIKKEGEYWEKGKKKHQGKRSDINEMIKVIQESDTFTEATEKNEQIFRYLNQYKKIKEEQGRKIKTEYKKLNVYAFIGATGTGKTRAAVEMAKALTGSYYKITRDVGVNLWWDGYQGEKTIILDEFEGWIEYETIKNILDGYPLRLPIKGSFTYANFEYIFLTSNNEIDRWYLKERNIDALKRRIDKIYEFEEEKETIIEPERMKVQNYKQVIDDLTHIHSDRLMEQKKAEEEKLKKVIDLTCDEELDDTEEYSDGEKKELVEEKYNLEENKENENPNSPPLSPMF